MKWQIAALGLLAGCAPTPQLAAPAPAGALDCAIREAEEIGYRRLASNRQMGVRMGKYIPETPGRAARAPSGATAGATERDLGDAVLHGDDGGPLESQFRVWYRGGQLRFEIISERDGPSVETQVTGDATEDAARILALCGG